jgi:hypothetical protein
MFIKSLELLISCTTQSRKSASTLFSWRLHPDCCGGFLFYYRFDPYLLDVLLLLPPSTHTVGSFSNSFYCISSTTTNRVVVILSRRRVFYFFFPVERSTACWEFVHCNWLGFPFFFYFYSTSVLSAWVEEDTSAFARHTSSLWAPEINAPN